MINEYVLKSLFLYKNGENKGFLKLMKQQRNKGMIESAMNRFIERKALIVCDKDLETIKAMHDLCISNPSVDSDMAKHVDYLYQNIYCKSNQFKCGGAL